MDRNPMNINGYHSINVHNGYTNHMNANPHNGYKPYIYNPTFTVHNPQPINIS